MLGRKQSVRNNEDWKNALDHIEETVSKKELDSLVKKTVKDIKEKCKGKKAAYAWSAGLPGTWRDMRESWHRSERPCEMQSGISGIYCMDRAE